MSKIDLGYGTTADASGEDIIISAESPSGDVFTLALHPTQVTRLFEFAVREGLIKPHQPKPAAPASPPPKPDAPPKTDVATITINNFFGVF
jgi:hypothetical protein